MLFEMGSDIQSMYWSFVMYELKPQHRLPQQVATGGSNADDTEGSKGLDESEFGDLMGEKLAASREGIVRKSTWGTVRFEKEKMASYVVDPENENPFNRKDSSTRVDASSIFNKLGYEKCKSIIDARMSQALDLDHSPIFKVQGEQSK